MKVTSALFILAFTLSGLAVYASELKAPVRPDCFAEGQQVRTLEGDVVSILEAHCDGQANWYLTERTHDPAGPVRRTHSSLTIS